MQVSETRRATLPTTSSAYDLGADVAKEYAAVEKQFQTISDDVHLPQLDRMVYAKYFIQEKTVQRLEHLKIIVRTLDSHRQATLRLLKLISEREAIVRSIRDKADLFAAKKITTLEAQTTVLQQLYHHQQVTLKIVEGIFAWRESLTRPFPFIYNGANYLRKIVADCSAIDGSALKTILPLRVAAFPLCSNISALKLFSGAANATSNKATPDHSNTFRRAQHKAEWQSTSTPSTATPTKRGSKPGTGVAPPMSPKTLAGGSSTQDLPDPALTQRLRAAESVLFMEAQAQVTLMKELMNMASKQKSFVTLLSVSEIVPNCSTGIPVTDNRWESQLRKWVAAALHRAESELNAGDLADSPPRAAAKHDDSSDSSDDDQSPPQKPQPSAVSTEAPTAPANQTVSTLNDTYSPARTPSASSRRSSVSSVASPLSTAASPERVGQAEEPSPPTAPAADPNKLYDDEFDADD